VNLLKREEIYASAKGLNIYNFKSVANYS